MPTRLSGGGGKGYLLLLGRWNIGRSEILDRKRCATCLHSAVMLHLAALGRGQDHPEHRRETDAKQQIARRRPAQSDAGARLEQPEREVERDVRVEGRKVF
jgi:hypothetical protein